MESMAVTLLWPGLLVWGALSHWLKYSLFHVAGRFLSIQDKGDAEMERPISLEPKTTKWGLWILYEDLDVPDLVPPHFHAVCMYRLSGRRARSRSSQSGCWLYWRCYDLSSVPSDDP